MKTATFAREKTRSAERLSVGIGRAFTRYRRPRRCTAERKASSGLVSRERLPRMTARTEGLLAHDPLSLAR